MILIPTPGSLSKIMNEDNDNDNEEKFILLLRSEGKLGLKFENVSFERRNNTFILFPERF